MDLGSVRPHGHAVYSYAVTCMQVSYKSGKAGNSGKMHYKTGKSGHGHVGGGGGGGEACVYVFHHAWVGGKIF